jgi:hypothetical protein
VKPKANLRVGVSGDTTTARSIAWLLPPVTLLPDAGPLVIGTAPPMRRSRERAWRRMAAERGVQQPARQA